MTITRETFPGHWSELDVSIVLEKRGQVGRVRREGGELVAYIEQSDPKPVRNGRPRDPGKVRLPIASEISGWLTRTRLTRRAAAGALGVSLHTLDSYRQGRRQPRGLALRALMEIVGKGI